MKENALAWAEAGFRVFPCVPDGKRPAVDSGHKEATTDPETISRWWDENPSCNIGMVPGMSGITVIDIDDISAAESLDFPGTYTVRTPRGGLHLYYAGDAPTTVGKLAKGIDTRGQGTGYVLVPPSIVNGNPYVTETETEFTPLPAWIGNKLKTQSAPAKADENFREDTEANINRARHWLQDQVAAGRVAVQGEGGDAKTFLIAREMLDLGVSRQTALNLLLEIWNPACIPPWSRDDLAIKVDNAAKYGQNEPGAKAAEPPETTFKDFKKHGKKPWFWLKDEAEQSNQPPMEWLFPQILPAQGITMLYGPPGSYKSFIALDIALTVASGIPGFNRPGMSAPKDVVYFTAEGSHDLETRRRPAWKMLNRITEPLPFYTSSILPPLNQNEQIDVFATETKKRGINPKLIVIDTLSRAILGMTENKLEDARTIIHALEYIKTVFGCQVLVIHHTGKDEQRGARGSSVLLAEFDTVFEVQGAKVAKFAEVNMTKQRDAEKMATPIYYQGEQHGGTLAFNKISRKDYETYTQEPDSLSVFAVGDALRQMGAIGPENAVTLDVLAAQLAANLGINEKLIKSKLIKDKYKSFLTKDKLWCVSD